MAITTYAELKVAIARWVGLSDSATVSQLGISSSIDDLITIAEQRIFREARTRDQEDALSGVIASGVLAIPTDYVALKYAYIDASQKYRLERRPAEWLYSQYPHSSSSGIPKFIARDGGNFVFGPYPDSGYTVTGVYYRKLGNLSDAVHDLFTNNPDLYLFGALAETETIVGNDKRIQLWEAKYKRILDLVNGQDQAENGSGSTLQMRIM